MILKGETKKSAKHLSECDIVHNEYPRTGLGLNTGWTGTEHGPLSLNYVRSSSQLMLYREIMAVCSEIHTKHINTLCGQNVELLNVKLAVHIVTTGL